MKYFEIIEAKYFASNIWPQIFVFIFFLLMEKFEILNICKSWGQ